MDTARGKADTEAVEQNRETVAQSNDTGTKDLPKGFRWRNQASPEDKKGKNS